MNVEALKKLAEEAKAFGKAYAAVKEALMQEGVREAEAIEVARHAAEFSSVDFPTEHAPDCPLCGD